MNIRFGFASFLNKRTVKSDAKPSREEELIKKSAFANRTYLIV